MKIVTSKNLWEVLRTVVRGKIVILNVYILKIKKGPQISDKLAKVQIIPSQNSKYINKLKNKIKIQINKLENRKQ